MFLCLFYFSQIFDHMDDRVKPHAAVDGHVVVLAFPPFTGSEIIIISGPGFIGFDDVGPYVLNI